MDFFKNDNTEKSTENSLWVESYRPKVLDDYIGNEHIKDTISRYISQNDIGHLLLHGKAGTGKTTLAKIVVGNIDCDYIIINASDERGINTIRNKVKGFASTLGFKQKKIIILDECLDENTLVSVLREGNDVKIPIKDIDEKNDLVKSYNIEEGKIEYRPFYLWDKGEQDVYEIELENDEVVVCTEDHKWYARVDNEEVKVVKTNQLHLYNHILSPEKMSMKQIKIKSIKKKKERSHVYDLSVEGNHNFFIGNSETLTHNCDYLTPEGQASLRNIMETFSQHTRFILTCNYPEKIIPAIQSRCQSFQVVPPSKKDVAIHVSKLMDKEGIEHSPKDLAPIVDKMYPDIRKIINTCQFNSSSGKLKMDKKTIMDSDVKSKVVDILKSSRSNRDKYKDIRQTIANSNIHDFTDFYTYLYEHVDDYGKGSTSAIILILSEQQYKDSMVVDKEIPFIAGIIEIVKVLN